MDVRILKELASSVPGGSEHLLPVQCDLREKTEIMRMFDVIKDHWGGVDVCINNAGLALGPSIIEGDSEEWENMWQVPFSKLTNIQFYNYLHDKNDYWSGSSVTESRGYHTGERQMK